jgi:hypothetical protein
MRDTTMTEEMPKGKGKRGETLKGLRGCKEKKRDAKKV